MTVVQLEPWSVAAGRPVALMIEDITELARLASMVERNEERYGALLNAVDAAVWEMDTSTWTVELMSAQALALTGYRDVFYVGRSGALVDRVAAPRARSEPSKTASAAAPCNSATRPPADRARLRP